MSEPTKPRKPFARVILVNLVVVILLFAAQRVMDAPGYIMILLLLQALVNLAMAQDADFNKAAHLLSAILLVIVGLGQCKVHLGSH